MSKYITDDVGMLFDEYEGEVFDENTSNEENNEQKLNNKSKNYCKSMFISKKFKSFTM